MAIRTRDDVAALEAKGYDAVFPHRSPHALIAAAAARDPEAIAIRYVEDAGEPGRVRDLSYGALLARIHAAAHLFRNLGVGPDDAVAILATHTPAAQIALWGAELAGRAAPVNPVLRPDHVAALLKAAGASVAVVMGVNPERDFWTPLVPALREAGVALPILDCDGEGASPGSDGAFEALVEARLGEPPAFAVEGGEEATAAFYHTGGTTGAPKLVVHTRRNQAHVARACALMHDLSPADVVLNGFPLFHVAGAFVYGLSTLSAGGTLLVPGRLGMRNRAFTGTIWRQVDRHRITVLGAVPTMLSAFTAAPVDADISSLRAILTGGSPLPPELADAAHRKLRVPVRNILGMTECAGGIAVEPVHGPHTPASCGLPLPFVSVAVLGERDGGADLSRPLAPGETGIVALKGPNVAAGYTDPAVGEETFPGDGWLVTGDLGHLDHEGRLFVTGRKKDVIIRGGHNIDPRTIEDALVGHPDVIDAAAVGMPDAYAGELPVAFVTLRPEARTDEAALLAFLRPRILEPAALPKRVGILTEMPVTPIGKIFKPALRKHAVGWAVAAVAAREGLEEGAYRLEIGDDLRARLEVPASARAAVAAALTGMPVTYEVTATERVDG